MIGVIPRTAWQFCTKRNQWSHSLVHRISRMETLLPVHRNFGENYNSVDETAKAVAAVADKLKGSEKTIECDKKLDNIIQKLDAISNEVKQASAAELKASRLQFAMRYTEHIAQSFSLCDDSYSSYNMNEDSVECLLLTFRQGRGYFLPEEIEVEACEDFAKVLEDYIGHRPVVEYDDEVGCFFLRYY